MNVMNELELARRRLRRVYEVSKLMASFGGGAARTAPKIIAAVRDPLPLRPAIASVSLDPPLMVITRADGVSDFALQLATARARVSCDYLAGAPGVADRLERDEGAHAIS